eukprot:6476027-Amphidinium_carterae.1
MAERPSPRTKEVLATLRGVGGGKTRALEEMRWELLDTDAVPLAITYNSGMPFLDVELTTWSKDYRINYALGVVARLASVLYGRDLAEMRGLLRARSTNWGWNMDDDAYPKELIRGFLKHAVAKLKQVRDRRISGIIVLADEVMKAEDAFVDKYKLEAEVE